MDQDQADRIIELLEQLNDGVKVIVTLLLSDWPDTEDHFPPDMKFSS